MNSFTHKILIFLIGVKLICFSVATDDVNPDDTQLSGIKKLRAKLFANYSKTDRPVQHYSETTTVNFTFAVIDTVEYEERNETLTIEAFFRLKWIDSRWVWNPSEYQGIDFFQVEADEIWLPDFGIYESVPAQMLTNKQYTKPMIKPQGLIIWAPRGVFKTLCSFNVDNYPKDIQVCNLTFGSWTEDGFNVDLQVETQKVYRGIATDNVNNKWKLLDVKSNRVDSYRSKMANPFSNVVVTVRFQRNSPVENKVVSPPTVVATFLMLSMFWLPPSSEKKLTLGASALFMLLGLLLYVAASVKSPLVIGTAVSPIRSVIFITISALLSEIIVIILSKLRMSPPPKLKDIVNGNMGRILCLNSPNKPIINEDLQIQENIGPEDTWYKTAMAADRFFFVLFVNIVILNQIL